MADSKGLLHSQNDSAAPGSATSAPSGSESGDSLSHPAPAPAPPSGAFRPVFLQPLGGSREVAQRTTYRFRVPVARAGTHLRFVFRSGEGPLLIHQATVARADADGALGSSPLPLTFSGSQEARLGAREERTSDAVLFPVEFREELAVSFEVEGSVAADERALFPMSYAGEGSFAGDAASFGSPQAQLVGLRGIEVDEPGECVAVVGSDAREGDWRETWPAVAERLLGIPVLDLGSARDTDGLRRGLAVLSQCTRARCMVLPEPPPDDGGETTASALAPQAALAATLGALRPACELYAATLPGDTGRQDTGSAGVNTWLRANVPSDHLLEGEDGGPAGEAPDPVRLGSAVAARLGGQVSAEAVSPLTLQVTYQDNAHEVLAMDPRGTLYAVAVGDSRARLWASTDSGRTWTRRATHGGGYDFFKMTSLADGTLLANMTSPSGYALSRSTDHGATWKVVLTLGKFRMLQPHNIRELHGEVFYLEYQTFSEASPINLWVSKDQGVTWRVRYVFQGRRHGHGLVADAKQGVLWAMMGDLHGGLLRSEDEGFTWHPVVDGPPGVAVDGVVTSRGLLFGTDNLYAPPLPAVQLVTPADVMVRQAALPGPSYSITAIAGGGFILGTTRETGGDVYAADDVSAHVYFSADGKAWTEFRAFPRLTDTDYARADVYWQLPSGELVLELSNTRELGPRGFLLLKAVRGGAVRPSGAN